MKYKNEFNESKKYRLGNYQSGFEWHTVRPGEIVDIPEHIAENLGLSVVENDIQEIFESQIKDIVEDEVAVEEPEMEEATEEDEQWASKEALKEYRKHLIDIKGVGKKIADEVMKEYPTEDDLRKAVQDNKEIHNRDDVDALIKELYGA